MGLFGMTSYRIEMAEEESTISHKDWKRKFKDCPNKLHVEKCGGKRGAKTGGTDTRCGIRAQYNFVGWSRCWYSKCPRAKKSWPETRANFLATAYTEKALDGKWFKEPIE
jgi:hypothetical protein